MVEVNSYCKKCNKFYTVEIDSSNPNTHNDLFGKWICSYCKHKYYSKSAKRNQKINILLKKSLFERIKSLFF